MGALKAFKQNTALILIDLQNDFCHPEGTASMRGTKVKEFKPTLKCIQTLLSKARKYNLPIIHAISEHSDWTQSPSQNERFGRTNQNKSLSYCEPDSWGAEIYHPFKPLKNEKVIIKHRYSAFYETDLELILRSLDIQQIILTGLYTNVCVDSTARDGYMRDFHVTVPKDCVLSNDLNKHKYALTLLDNTFATLTSTKELISFWKKSKGEYL